MRKQGETGLVAALVVGALVVYFLPVKFKLALTQLPARVLLMPLNWTKHLQSSILILKNDNERLSQQVSELQYANIALREDTRRANGDLSLAGFVFKRAQVVGRDFQTLVRSIVINQGERLGLKSGMAVLGDGGLVGKIVQAAPDQSVVETILSPSLRMGALDQRSRVVGIVRGPALTMEYVALDEDVMVGDTVVTSGLGDMFPPGLPIGVVATVEGDPGGIFKRIRLKPLVRVAAIEQVSVVISCTELPRAVEAIAESAQIQKMNKIRRIEFKHERPSLPPRRIEASQPF